MNGAQLQPVKISVNWSFMQQTAANHAGQSIEKTYIYLEQGHYCILWNQYYNIHISVTISLSKKNILDQFITFCVFVETEEVTIKMCQVLNVYKTILHCV